MVVVWLPVLILFGMFVFEVGNWFEHKRHLQMQADAGAFAGGGLFNGVLRRRQRRQRRRSRPRRASTRATRRRRRASTIRSADANQGSVTARINRKTFEVGGPSPDDTVEAHSLRGEDGRRQDDRGRPAVVLRLAFVPAINARARVEIEAEGTSAGALPVGVPDNNPVAGAVLFIDETNGGSIIAIQSLTKGAATTMNGDTLTQWATAGAPVNVASARTGVIVALSGIPCWSPTAR